MNRSTGRFAPSALALLALAGCAFAGSAQAQVTCAVNPMTGRLEAALAWKNTLGADRANAMCQSLQTSAATEVQGIPTSRGTVTPPSAMTASAASTASTAVDAPIQRPEPDAFAKQILSRMDARNTGAAAPASTTPVTPVLSRAPADAPASAATAVDLTDSSVSASAAPAVITVTIPQSSSPTAAATTAFAITPRDRTFREVVGKWSSMAGWSFAPEDWALSRDIPIGGADVFTGDFKTAVRALLKSSLLSDMPGRPCFYSNHVVRVIAASELCQRSDL